jgi:mannose/fructose-specific phosphotransferase system component IIA
MAVYLNKKPCTPFEPPSPSSEKLLEGIKKASSNKVMIVADFLGGSSITVAVAHTSLHKLDNNIKGYSLILYVNLYTLQELYKGCAFPFFI